MAEVTKPTKKEKRSRQTQIANYWFKGYSKEEILDKIDCKESELNADLKLIKKRLSPRTVKVLEYRKNLVLNKLALVQHTAWEIASKSKSDTIKLSSLRVVTSSQELEAKVEGVTQEKLVNGPEKEADALIKKAVALEEERKKAGGDSGNGHKKVEVPLPF